jgi:hypothetical protein
MAVELSQFIFQVSDDIASISTGIELWDLTYRVDQNHVLGVLQFETRCRHEKIQIEGKFYTESRIATNIRTLESTFYLTSGLEGPLSTYVVDELMGYINSSIRYVQFYIFHVTYKRFLTNIQGFDERWQYISMGKPCRIVAVESLTDSSI